MRFEELSKVAQERVKREHREWLIKEFNNSLSEEELEKGVKDLIEEYNDYYEDGSLVY
jgi:hypothetical protein